MLQPRLIQLDVLRAICVFLVLGRHLNPCPPDTNFYLHHFTLGWNYGGWVGVDIFFVLSGFLVSGLLFREYQKSGNLEIKRFLIRRGLKIYPAFYAMIAATVLVRTLFENGVLIRNVLAEIFFVQNLNLGKLWEHTWSLAVEEHFYIGLAILTFFLFRFWKSKSNPFAPVPYLFIFIAVTCFILRLLMAIYKGTNISPTFFRIDSLFFGVTISYFRHFRGLAKNYRLKKNAGWLIAAGAILLFPMFFFMSVTNSWAFVIGLTTNYIAGGLLLLGFLNCDFKDNVFIKNAAYIGTFSYSIYLWHLPVQDWLAFGLMQATGIENWFFYAGFYLIGAILFGIILSKIIEYPVLRIRDKYFPPLNPALNEPNGR